MVAQRTSFRWLLISCLLGVLVHSGASGADSPSFGLFGGNDAVRVFEDGYGLSDKRPEEVRLFGIRNEVVSAQCVVKANGDLENLTVSVGQLKSTTGSAAIPAGDVEWNFVESIFIEQNTPKMRKSDLIRPAPAQFPDYLGESRQCSLPQGTCKAVYLTIRIPADADPGEYRARVTATCGDANLSLPLLLTVYPNKDGLLNSLRWEQMRGGLQDYECLWLLENKISEIRSTLSPRIAELIQPSRRPMEIATRVVKSYEDFTRDPAVLYAAKRQAIEETLNLDKSPRVILQTTPCEHSPLAADCAVDVHGWAEPGTEIRINGQDVPVASDGLFIDHIRPSSEGRIGLDAEKEDGKMTIVREFELLQ